MRMWEVRAQQRNFTELLAWVCDVAVPAIEQSPLHMSSEVFTSPDFRLVVISQVAQHTRRRSRSRRRI